MQEPLCETNFPDLLEGVPAAPLERRKRKKKKSKKPLVHHSEHDLLNNIMDDDEKQEEEHVAPVSKPATYSKPGKQQDFLDAVDVSPSFSTHSSRSPNAVDADLGNLKTSKVGSSADFLEASPNLDIPDLDIEQSVGSSSIDDDKSCSEGEDEEDTSALLQRAQDRVARQELQERVAQLEIELAKKRTDLQKMHGQLRMATATKCDLVVAHNELEQTHESTVAAKNQNLIQMKQANQILLELQAQTDFELLNELIRVTDLFHSLQVKHQEELDDWERMHRNEMLEKDYEIARLVEELRQAGLRPAATRY